MSPSEDMEAIHERRRFEDARITAALRASGIGVSSVFDFVNGHPLPSQAIPILSEILPSLSDSWMRGGVVRALTDKKARGQVTASLIAELRRAASEGAESLVWTIGNALIVVGDESALDAILAYASRPELGPGRQTLLEALARFPHDDRVIPVLIDALGDDEVAAHALIALRKLRAVGALDAVEALTNHSRPLVRKEAVKTLRALQKS